MPKNQKLSALEQAILDIEAAAPAIAKRQREAIERANARSAKRDKEYASGKSNPMHDAFLAIAGIDTKADGGEIKKPGVGFKPMDMGGDILNSYLEGVGNSKDTTIKGGGNKSKPKPVKKAKGGAVSPRKAQGMMYGGSVRKKK